MAVGLVLTAVVLIGIAAMFSRAGALFPGRARAAMGLANMLGIIMILGSAPLVGTWWALTGIFKASFVVFNGFSLLVCAATPLLDSDEPAPRPLQ